MKDISPTQWGLLFAVLLLSTIAFALGYLLFAGQDVSVDFSPDGLSIDLNKADLEYVIPIDRGTPLSAPERSQLRGEVASIDSSTMVVKVNDELWNIGLNKKVFLRCLPLTMTAGDGEEIPTKDILLDFSKATEKGALVPVEDLMSQFSSGDDITVQVEEDNEGEARIDFIVGYGCEF